MYCLSFSDKHSLILSDSITKLFHEQNGIEKITRCGADPVKLLKFIEKEENQDLINGYEIIVIHVGTNSIRYKEEWALFLNLINKEITQDVYELGIKDSNNNPKVSEINFYTQMKNLIDFIQGTTQTKIIISAILPRPYDHERRLGTVLSFNKILEQFHHPQQVISLIPLKTLQLLTTILRPHYFVTMGYI